MKFLVALISMQMVVFGACKEVKLDPIADFIPGTYIRFSEHEFGKEYDTLVIADQSGLYSIERRWKYERILDGQIFGPEYKKTVMTGVLNEDILTEQQTGAHYSFDVSSKCLYSRDKRYYKL